MSEAPFPGRDLGRGTEGEHVQARSAASPYSTGAGGVTFERRVGVTYLARLLTGEGASELGDARSVVKVSFQQAPDVPVDDLVVLAARSDEEDPSLELAVGVRRAPIIVQSNDDTKKLVVEYVRALLNAPDDGRDHQLALVVAGPQQHAQQLGDLTALAVGQADAPGFFTLVRTPQRFAQALVDRLGHVTALVRNALVTLGVDAPDDALVEQRAWQLLSRLSVLMPRLEAPDEGDWSGIQNSLLPVARGNDLAGAGRLRDRLEVLAAQYAPVAAAVDQTLLHRDVHLCLAAGAGRHPQGWAALDHLNTQAVASVRDIIGASDGHRQSHVDRSAEAAGLLAAAGDARALVVHGDSGVGKSALAVLAATDAATTNPDEVQAVCINLRQIPETSLTLEATLGIALPVLLRQLSAPQRLLVIDAADAITEGKADTFAYLVGAAHKSDVRVIAVSASDTRQLVHDALADRLALDVGEYAVDPLTDAQIDHTVDTFPELRVLAANQRSRELLRRLVVIDLLVRSDVSGVPLSDADAMAQVWDGLVRRREQTDRGMPDARELVLMRLAEFALSGGDAMSIAASFDAPALDGLRRDGLVRDAVDNPWQVMPEFTHDEVRRYAVARLLLVKLDPAGELRAAGAPRWALPAARLACQALLGLPDRASQPLHGRLRRVQSTFDALVDDGHGARWADVPGEALLTVGDPGPLLVDAWTQLRDGDASGLRRLARLVDQSHRTAHFVDPVIVEPIVGLLLDEPTPWWSGDYIERLLREWLLTLVARDEPQGHDLRIRLRDLLIAACAAADQRLVEETEAAAAARAARTPEQIEEERGFLERNRMLFTEIGYPRSSPRRERPAVPREITEDAVLELLALLGADTGDTGEAVLRRVANDAPQFLAPAVEEVLTARALSQYGNGLLAALTEAYYLDEEDDGSFGLMDDGIRHHHMRGFVTPLHAYWRGPFMDLFRTDFRRGVGVLNRLLNHSARVRATSPDPWGATPPLAAEPTGLTLNISGEERLYVGDDSTWLLYRGTGVGPYPCTSALAALERVCDLFIAADTPLPLLVSILLDGCENLAIPALIVGILVRHLDRAEKLLDPFLAEPRVWNLEFNRAVSETSGLAASSEGVVEPDRRHWSLREAGTWLVLNADVERAAELREVGARLVAASERIAAPPEGAPPPVADEQRRRDQYVSTVRGWASGLDRDRYRLFTEDGVTYVQAVPPEDVVEALQPGNDDLARGHEATRLLVRYYIQPRRERPDPVPDDELASDLAVAQELLDNPPAAMATDPWDAPAAVAAVALDASLARGAVLSPDRLGFAAEVVLRVAEGEGGPRPYESDVSYFEQGADRSAARALPLLMLPLAASLRSALDGDDGSRTYARVVNAGIRLAHAVADETRLHFGRGFDRVWDSPCAEGACHHEDAFAIVVETVRDSALGEFDFERQRRSTVRLEGPLADAIAGVDAKSILMSRFDAAIRPLGSAAVSETCVASKARDLLLVLVAAQRRALVSYEQSLDHRGSHALVSARALVDLSAHGDNSPLFEHIDAYADRADLLGGFLHAVAAAAEETESRAAAARRVWPEIMTRVLAFSSEHHPFRNHYHGDTARAALIPTPTYEVAFLYREVEGTPIVWPDALAWRAEIEAWLAVAAGNASCVDSLIGLVRSLSAPDQVTTGLPWISTLVEADVDAIARRSFLLTGWLVEIRPAAEEAGAIEGWQRLVDALVVAGDSQLAPYAE